MRNEQILLILEQGEYGEAFACRMAEEVEYRVQLARPGARAAESATFLGIIVPEEFSGEIPENQKGRTLLLTENKEAAESGQRISGMAAVWKYADFSQILLRLWELLFAAEAEAERDWAMRKGLPPVILAGAWQADESEGLRLARQIAAAEEHPVLFLTAELFTSEELPKGRREGEAGPATTLEEFLYYVVQKKKAGCPPAKQTVEQLLRFEEGVCSLPPSWSLNALRLLQPEEWKILLTALCGCREFAAVVLWACDGGGQATEAFPEPITACVYLKPEEKDAEDVRWKRLSRFMRGLQARKKAAAVCFADSGAQLQRQVISFVSDVG